MFCDFPLFFTEKNLTVLIKKIKKQKKIKINLKKKNISKHKNKKNKKTKTVKMNIQNDTSLMNEAKQQRQILQNINQERMDAIFNDRNNDLVDKYYLQNSFPANFENGIEYHNNIKNEIQAVPEPINFHNDMFSNFSNDDSSYLISDRTLLNESEFKIDPLKSEMNPHSSQFQSSQNCQTQQPNASQKKNFLAQTSLHHDSCKQNYKDVQSVYEGNYQLAPYSRFRENRGDTSNMIYNNVTTPHFREGYSPGSCQISVDSNLRLRSDIMTSSRNRKELPAFHVSAPNKELGTGTIPPNDSYRTLEDYLQKPPIIHTRTPYNEKDQQYKVRVEFDRYVEPQLPQISSNIQKPENIIQEVATPDFIRGGFLTRNWLHDQVITYGFNRADGKTPYTSRPNNCS